jgi:hypothetical protein
MSDHEIVWTFDTDYVTAEMVCHLADDARCHQAPSCDCESWTVEDQDGDGYYHEYQKTMTGGSVTERHRHRPVDYCGIGAWLNADSPMECAVEDVRFVIGRTPIEPVWSGEYMQWQPVMPDWERKLLSS